MRRSWQAWCYHHSVRRLSGGLLHVACGVNRNIATGGERVGRWGVGLQKEFNMRKLAGRERGGGGIYCSLFMNGYDQRG